MPLSTLKKLVLQPEKLSETENHFFDLMDQGILLKVSQPIPDPMKKELLVNMLNAIQVNITKKLHKQITVIPLVFSETASDYFYQGIFSISGFPMPGTIFYFSDIEMGAFLYLKNGNNEMLRFSLIKVTDLGR